MNPDLDDIYTKDYYYELFVTLAALLAACLACLELVVLAKTWQETVVDGVLGLVFFGLFYFVFEVMFFQLILVQVPPINYIKTRRLVKANMQPAEEGQAVLTEFEGAAK